MLKLIEAMRACIANEMESETMEERIEAEVKRAAHERRQQLSDLRRAFRDPSRTPQALGWN